MLRNYLTTAYRHLLRHRTTTLMNVVSLSIGISCCLVVYVIVRHEYTYDLVSAAGRPHVPGGEPDAAR